MNITEKTAMMSSSQTAMTQASKKIAPFSIQQAMVALELGSTDNKILEYLDFLTAQIPTGSAYFLHVLPRFNVLSHVLEREGESTVSNYEINDEVVDRMQREIRARMDHRDGLHVQFDVKEGDPLEQLLEDAEDVDAELTVIGQKSGADKHGILGKNLARKTKGNTLIIPDQAKVQMKHMIVPIDFSKNSIKALRTAIAINESLSEPARITVLNVYEMPNLSVYKIQRTREQFERMLQKDHEEAMNAFLNTQVPDHRDKLDTKLIMQETPGVAQYIVDTAKEQKGDFIVMGAKGHSKVELLLLGSVTEKLLGLNERIPTLVVK